MLVLSLAGVTFSFFFFSGIFYKASVPLQPFFLLVSRSKTLILYLFEKLSTVSYTTVM